MEQFTQHVERQYSGHAAMVTLCVQNLSTWIGKALGSRTPCGLAFGTHHRDNSDWSLSRGRLTSRITSLVKPMKQGILCEKKIHICLFVNASTEKSQGEGRAASAQSIP